MSDIINRKLIVSSSPHIQNDESTTTIMYTVSLFLLPAAVFGALIFGMNAFLILFSSVVVAVISEAVCQKIMKRDITILDGSALLTGLLVGMNMPPDIPLYIPIISSAFAIIIVKQAFGGLGCNWANPALGARVFAFTAWSKEMTTWKPPLSPDGTTSATPLGAVKSFLLEQSDGVLSGPMDVLQSLPQHILKSDVDYLKLFFGYKGGCIGEISVFLLLLGGIYLIYRKIITLDIPVTFLGTVALLSWIFDGLNYGNGYFTGDPLFHLLTGGVVLGALFMATDMVTTPLTTKGRLIFGTGCGLLTIIVRMFGGMPEGVSVSILFMNMLTPAIDRFIKIKPLGFSKRRSK